MSEQSKIPELVNGFVSTLNQMGYMTAKPDPISKEFIDYSIQDNLSGSILDVGAAYGVATIPVLKHKLSTQRVIALDIDHRHLELLKSSAINQGLEVDSLELITSKFPDGSELDLHVGSVASMLICRVLHFFNGELVERSFKKAYSLLQSGAKLFVVNETPYLNNFKEFIPIFEKRKAKGVKYPGYIEDVQAVAPERGKNLPKTIHFFDPDSMSDFAKNAGFVVEKAEFINRTDFPSDLRLDGRESVGIVCRKP